MKTYTVMSLNLLTDRLYIWGDTNFGRRSPAVIQMIREHEPDLIGTQEYTIRMHPDLAALSEIYGTAGTYRTRHFFKEANMILYRKERFSLLSEKTYWLSPRPEKPGSRFMTSIFPRIITITRLLDRQDGTELVFASTHLDHVSEYTRSHQAEIILKLLMPYSSMPVILTGDFNSIPGSKTMTYFTNAGFTDLVPAGIGSTLTGPVGSYSNHNRPIDHILISCIPEEYRTEKITEKYEGVLPSDHYPVISTITVKN